MITDNWTKENLVYDDNWTKLYQGNCLDILRTLPENNINCVMTSPPYFRQRNYLTPPIIFGGDINCKHIWVSSSKYWDNRHASVLATSETDTLGSTKDFRSKLVSEICSVCSAYKGHLGLEETVEQFISHLVCIFREVRRVLRDDGVCFVNIGNSYNGSGGSGVYFNEGGRR